jgi:hypothetical protein
MKKLALVAALAAATASPALAAGGLHCRTAGARPIELNMTIGHVFGSPLVSTRLVDAGRNVPVTGAQWWYDRTEVRLLLTRPDAAAEELVLRAKRSGSVYDGSLWRRGQRRWVRCREA